MSDFFLSNRSTKELKKAYAHACVLRECLHIVCSDCLASKAICKKTKFSDRSLAMIKLGVCYSVLCPMCREMSYGGDMEFQVIQRNATISKLHRQVHQLKNEVVAGAKRLRDEQTVRNVILKRSKKARSGVDSVEENFFEKFDNNSIAIRRRTKQDEEEKQ